MLILIRTFRPILLACLLLFASSVSADKSDFGIVVIMGPGSTQLKLTRDDIALIFKSKRRFWENGLRIQAVNLPASHPLRRAFSMQVYKQNPEELDEYWSDMYFHGVLPPYVFSSEEAVIRFISSTPGAIGYISHCSVDHRISVIVQLDNGSACQR